MPSGVSAKNAREHVPGHPPPVLHYMQRWLPLSEQFVHALVTRTRHPGVVVSRMQPEHTDIFEHRPLVNLGRLMPPPRPFTRTERRLLTTCLLAVAARHRTRLVHSHHGYRLRDVEGLVRRRRVPWVASLHGHDVTTHAREWPGDMMPVLPVVDAVIVPSAWLAEQVVELGVAPSRIHVIPSGVDTSFYTPTALPERGPEVVFIGRFVEKKGLDVLMKAWPGVLDAVPDARLRLVGFGPLEHLARQGDQSVTIDLAEPRRRALQVRDAIRAARVVVTPSRTSAAGDAETLLLVNLEAQASGRPLVTTRHGGIPEYVAEDRTCLMVPEGDPDALCDALVRVLDDEALARRLADAGPGFAAQFDVSNCVARVDDLYAQLLGGRR